MNNDNRSIRVFDHKVQRRIVGSIAILLAPVVSLLHGGPGILDSISSYYWSDGGTVFVAALSVVAMFLFAYNGTGGTFDLEFVLAKVGGLAALAVALFPTDNSKVAEVIVAVKGVGPPKWTDALASLVGLEPSTVHIIAAVVLFGILAAMLFIFSKRARDKGRAGRARIYMVFAGAMILGLLVGGVGALFFKNSLPGAFVYFLEFYMLVVFGCAWLLAGFYRNQDNENNPQANGAAA